MERACLVPWSAGGSPWPVALATWTPAQLTRAVARYTQWNSVFAGCVARLAGTLAARQDLFCNADESCPLLADRSWEVARLIFQAARDEFGAWPVMVTHRSLAQAFLRSVAAYTHADLHALTAAVLLHGPTVRAMRQTYTGYRQAESQGDAGVFAALGFHAASEHLAVAEFTALVQALEQHHPGLWCFLQAACDSNGVPASAWVVCHGVVEAEHAEAANQALTTAHTWYAGTASNSERAAWVEAGWQQFVDVQQGFFPALAAALR